MTGEVKPSLPCLRLTAVPQCGALTLTLDRHLTVTFLNVAMVPDNCCNGQHRRSDRLFLTMNNRQK